MRWTWVVLATLSAPAALAAQEPRVEVTLDEAIRRALQVQPDIVGARGDQRLASADRRSALGTFLPSVTTSWNTARSNIGRIDPVTGRPVSPEYTHTVGLSANLTLFDGLGRYSNWRASVADAAAADAGYLNARNAVTLATKILFYDAVGSEALVRTAEAQLARAQRQREISTEKLRAGSATRSDSLRSTVEYGQAQLALLEAQATLARAEAELGRQIGHGSPVHAVWEGQMPSFPDTTGLRTEAIDRSPTVQVADARARASRARVLQARSLYIPTLSVSYNDNHQGTGWPEFFTFDSYNETFTWRFGLTWTLFNGFQREGSNVATNVQRDLNESQAEETRRQMNSLITSRFATLVNSYTAIDIARSNLTAATEDFRVQTERYRVGASTILDLLTSQAQLTTAEVDLLRKNYDYVRAIAELEALVGRDVP